MCVEELLVECQSQSASSSSGSQQSSGFTPSSAEHIHMSTDETPSHKPVKRPCFSKDPPRPKAAHRREISNAGLPVPGPVQNMPFSTFSLPPQTPPYLPTTYSTHGQQALDKIPELGDSGVSPGFSPYCFNTSHELPQHGQETHMLPSNNFNSNSFNTSLTGTNNDFDPQLAIPTQTEATTAAPLISETSTEGFVPQESSRDTGPSYFSYFPQPSAASEMHLFPDTGSLDFQVSGHNNTQSNPFQRSGTRSWHFGDGYAVDRR
jgi:hypothetical protein